MILGWSTSDVPESSVTWRLSERHMNIITHLGGNCSSTFADWRPRKFSYFRFLIVHQPRLFQQPVFFFFFSSSTSFFFPRETQLDIKQWQVKQAEKQRNIKMSAKEWIDHPDRYLLEMAGRTNYVDGGERN